MDRLSSCYFCGTALDEPLQDYPLVAGDTGEHGAVVTLCPGCHHKLETVLGVVVGEGEDLPALDDADRAALEGESPAALTEPAGDESTPDPIALGDGEESDGDGSDGEERGEAGSGETDDGGPDGAGDTDGETTPDPETVSEAGPDTGPEGAASGEGTAETRREAEPETATDAGADDAESPTAGREEANGDAAGSDATTAGGGDGDRGGGSGDSQGDGGGTDPDREVTASVSALEYNKVMRLLQNREFPVDRAEIEAVATSAYELSESECAAVIDLAVDRGLVAERDGQLVRPDE